MSTSMFKLSAAVLFALGLHGVAMAGDNGTRDEARAMADAAIEHVKKVGPEAGFKDFTDKGNAAWHKKDLYVFAMDMKGNMHAHGDNAKLIGNNLTDLRDPNGKLFVQEMRATAAKGGGWVDYEWTHATTRKIEPKTTYVKKFVNFDGFVAVGAYR